MKLTYPKMHKFILVSIAATLIPSSFIFLNRDAKKMLASVKAQFSEAREPDSTETATLFSKQPLDVELLKRELKGTRPDQMVRLLGELHNTKVPENQRMAAELALEGGIRYRYPGLMFQSVRFYMASPIRDFAKALQILEHPFLSKGPLRDFYRGLIWQDPANPARDVARARSYLESSSDAGLAAAGKALVRLDDQSRDQGNLQKLTKPQ
jgi:hypothetical protein